MQGFPVWAWVVIALILAAALALGLVFGLQTKTPGDATTQLPAAPAAPAPDDNDNSTYASVMYSHNFDPEGKSVKYEVDLFIVYQAGMYQCDGTHMVYSNSTYVDAALTFARTYLQISTNQPSGLFEINSDGTIDSGSGLNCTNVITNVGELGVTSGCDFINGDFQVGALGNEQEQVFNKSNDDQWYQVAMLRYMRSKTPCNNPDAPDAKNKNFQNPDCIGFCKANPGTCPEGVDTYYEERNGQTEIWAGYCISGDDAPANQGFCEDGYPSSVPIVPKNPSGIKNACLPNNWKIGGYDFNLGNAYYKIHVHQKKPKS